MDMISNFGALVMAVVMALGARQWNPTVRCSASHAPEHHRVFAVGGAFSAALDARFGPQQQRCALDVANAGIWRSQAPHLLQGFENTEGLHTLQFPGWLVRTRDQHLQDFVCVLLRVRERRRMPDPGCEGVFAIFQRSCPWTGQEFCGDP
jgi:hypothetical protein